MHLFKSDKFTKLIMVFIHSITKDNCLPIESSGKPINLKNLYFVFQVLKDKTDKNYIQNAIKDNIQIHCHDKSESNQITILNFIKEISLEDNFFKNQSLLIYVEQLKQIQDVSLKTKLTIFVTDEILICLQQN